MAVNRETRVRLPDAHAVNKVASPSFPSQKGTPYPLSVRLLPATRPLPQSRFVCLTAYDTVLYLPYSVILSLPLPRISPCGARWVPCCACTCPVLAHVLSWHVLYTNGAKGWRGATPRKESWSILWMRLESRSRTSRLGSTSKPAMRLILLSGRPRRSSPTCPGLLACHSWGLFCNVLRLICNDGF